MHILLAGNGNMAAAVRDQCAARRIKCTPFGAADFDHSDSLHGKPVAIHFGTGRQLPDLIGFCGDKNIPIIQGSTKLTNPVGDAPKIPIINAPNLSLPIIRFMMAFPAFAEAIKPGMEFGIVESHQQKKADTSGTARAIAKLMNIAETAIRPIRDPFEQLLRGVPQEHLSGHAYHDFVFKGQGVEIRASTRIHGRATYAEGAIALADALANQAEPLTPGMHELKDIMRLLPKT